MTDLKAQAEPTTEGWQAEKRYDQRRYHYISNTRSLCWKLGFYLGELTPAKLPLGLLPQREDCAECFRRCFRRLKRWKGAAK